MARNSIYVPQVGVPVAPAARVADTSPLIGQLGDKMFQAYDEIERREGNIETALKSSEIRARYLNRIRQDRDEGRISKGYTPLVLDELDNEIATAIGGAGNSYSRDGLTLALADLRGDVMTSALGVESDWSLTKHVADTEAMIDNVKRAVSAPGTPWTSAHKEYVTASALIDGLGIREDLKQGLKKYALGIGGEYMDNLVRTDPAAALDLLLTQKDHPIRQAFSPEHADIYINQPQSELAQREAKARAEEQLAAYEAAGETERLVKDTFAMADDGIFPERDTVVRATQYMKPKARSEYLAELNYRYEVGSTLVALDKQPNAALEARQAEIIAEREADRSGTEGYRERSTARDLQQKKIDLIVDQRTKDVVQAMRGSLDDVASAWDAYAQSAPEGRAAALRGAIEKTKAAHEMWGTPEPGRWLVTRGDAKAIAADLNNSAPNEASEKLLFYANALQPADWHRVYRQLKGAGLNPQMAVAATIVDPGKREIAIAASRADPKQMTVENLNVVRPTVAASSEWQALRASLGNSGDTIGDIGPAGDMIERYAVFLMTTKNETPETAVSEAIKAVVTDNYAFIKPGSFHVRIPVTAGVDQTRVRTTLNALLEAIDPTDTRRVDAKTGLRTGSAPQKLADLERPRAAPGTIAAEIDEQQRNGLSVNGGWITNEDETGVYLARGPSTIVKDRNGVPIHFKWKDLEQASNLGVLWSTYKGKAPPRAERPRPEPVKATTRKPPPIKRPAAAPQKPRASAAPAIQGFEPDDHPELYPGGAPSGAASQRAKANAKAARGDQSIVIPLNKKP